MNTVGTNIKRIRKEKGLTQKQLANLCNPPMADSAIRRYENNKANPKLETITKIAEALGVSLSDIKDDLNTTSLSSHKKGVKINVLGRVAAGIPIEAVTDIIDTEEITEEMAKTGTYFGLKIKGDSMTPTICDGDIVIVRQQNDAETGDIVIAVINGDDATCKRLKKYLEGIALISINSAYEPMYFTNEEIENTPVCIIGRVVELRRSF